MATHPKILAWKIPWTEESGWLQSVGSQKSWRQLSMQQLWLCFLPSDFSVVNIAIPLICFWTLNHRKASFTPMLQRNCSYFFDSFNSFIFPRKFLLYLGFVLMYWRRKWQPTTVFLPGESQGWGSLVGCCLWGHTESDTTEVT